MDTQHDNKSALLPSAQDAPAIRAGQRVICDGMGYIIEGLLIEDVEDSADLIVIREDDGNILEVRGDLCDQITVDGVDLF